MKNFISLTLVIIMLFSFCACSKHNELEKRVIEKVESVILADIMIGYKDELNWDVFPEFSSYVRSELKNEFEVTGKLKAKDKYGDDMEGKYDAYAIYDPDTDEIIVQDYNME